MASILQATVPFLTAPSIDLDGASLFLDFDGTLVEIVDRPDAVVVDPALPALLRGLVRVLPGRVALVSGRCIAQIDGFLGGALDGIAVAGSHGAEIRHADGTREAPGRPAVLARVAARFAAFAADDPGLVVEDKALGVGLHYRMSPGRESEAVALARETALAEGLVFQRGKMLAEVRVAGDKGAGLRALIAGEPAMRGTRPVFAGDDETDEAGFAAAAALGGAGILVGAARATAALHGLPDVPAVREWLMKVARA